MGNCVGGTWFCRSWSVNIAIGALVGNSMTHAIRPGDNIVCIDDSTYAEQYLGIKAGETYTCRWIGPCRSYLGGDYIGVRLAGINRGVCPQFGESDPPFRASRFRPLVGANDDSKVKKEELV